MLKTGTQEDKVKMFKQLTGEARALISTIIELVYYMRGAISYNEMMEMSYPERQLVAEFIEKRLEHEKNNPYPVY